MVKLFSVIFAILFYSLAHSAELKIKQIMGNRVTVESSQDIPIIEKNLIAIKKGAEEYRFKIDKRISDKEFIIRPIKDINVNEVCPKKCEFTLLELNPAEEFEIYYRLMVAKLNEKEKFFSSFDGVASLKYSTAGEHSVSGIVAPMAYNFGISAENFIQKKFSKNFLYGFSAGIGVDISILDLSKINFNYIPEKMTETTFINFYAPYTFHFIPFRNIGIYAGVNLNATLTTYSNDQTVLDGDTDLSRTSSLTGGLSLGYHGGVNIFLSNYLIQFNVHQYNFVITENLQYESLDSGKVSTYDRPAVDYDVSSTVISVGLGLSY